MLVTEVSLGVLGEHRAGRLPQNRGLRKGFSEQVTRRLSHEDKLELSSWTRGAQAEGPVCTKAWGEQIVCSGGISCVRYSAFNVFEISNAHVLKLRVLIIAFTFLTGKMRCIQ